MRYPPDTLEHVDAARDASRAFTEIAAASAHVDMRDPEMRRMARSPAVEPARGVEMRAVPGPAGDIPLRLIVPERVRGVHLDLHGGGWAMSCAANDDSENLALAHALDVAVVSVEYRMAPEHPHPAAVDDCEAAARWLVQHAAREFGSDRLLIGGFSAGAHLAAATLLRLRDRADTARPFRGANLAYGVFDLGRTPSNRGAQREAENWYIETFTPGMDREARRAPEVSPLYADLRGLPPALFSVGHGDALLDDSLFMAARWEAAGNHAELAVYPETVHGFLQFPTPPNPMMRVAWARCHGFLRRCLDGELES